MNQATFASTDEQFRNLPLKKVVGKFATFCWFHELEINLHAETPMEIPQAIETIESWNRTAIQRRWKTYQTGQHKPVNRVLDLAEKQVPGSKAIFRSPLWHALRLDKSAVKVARGLQGATSKEGDELLQWMLDHQRPSKSHRWLRKRCRAMVSHGSLEGLAILTVCMRLSIGTEVRPWTLTFYHHATDCLLILGIWFYLHGIAQAIADYYEKTLLPACYGKHGYGEFSANYYLNSIRVMASVLTAAQQKVGRELTYKEQVSAMLRQLDL